MMFGVNDGATLKRMLRQADKALMQSERVSSELERLLRNLKWKSVDKDNMEFECRVTCYTLGDIRRILREIGQ